MLPPFTHVVYYIIYDDLQTLGPYLYALLKCGVIGGIKFQFTRFLKKSCIVICQISFGVISNIIPLNFPPG